MAIEPYMPYTALKNGKLIGLDSEIFNYISRALHQRVKVVVTNFTGMLSDVQTRRVDVAIGGIAWSKSRASVGLFTDPPYYSPVALVEREGVNIRTISQMKGHSIGTVTGYIFAPAISAAGANLHTYQDAPTAFTALATGRVDALVIDTLLVIYQAKQRPSEHLHSDYLTPPSATQLKAHPSYAAFAPYMTGFYLPKSEKTLEDAMNTVIRRMYANGILARYLKQWGASPSKFLAPSPAFAAERHAVDRPASWQPPSAP